VAGIKTINIFIISLIVILAPFSSFASSVDSKLDATYREAQREYTRKNFKSALPLLEKYLTDSKKKKYKRERLFWVIDQIGRIHLRVNKNPSRALAFFENIVTDKRLSESEENDINAWIAAANDWKRYPLSPEKIKSPAKLFSTGELAFDKGKKKNKYPADSAGNGYFLIAANYLVPFINKYDNSPKLPEALLMMGEVRLHLRADPDYWSENFYLKELIRRYPHSNYSQRAYVLLEMDVRAGYTGSAGESTPPSLKKMLENYKMLSIIKPKKK